MLHSALTNINARLHHVIHAHASAVATILRLGQSFNQTGVQTQGLAHITQRRAGPVHHDTGCQRSSVSTIFFVNVLNHFFAARVFKVHINVGWFVTLAANKPLEQHSHFVGVDFGNVQAITHHGIGGRPAALTQNIAGTRKADNVVNR